MWHILYKSPLRRQLLAQQLDRAGIEHFIPTTLTEHTDDDGSGMNLVEEEPMRNLVFVRTEQNVYLLANLVAGLRAPYIDAMTGRPAVVSDEEMACFMRLMAQTDLRLHMLQDPVSKFKAHQRVRITDGPFRGLEGHIVRIRKDRKLVIAVGQIAMAIDGIDHRLLEPLC